MSSSHEPDKLVTAVLSSFSEVDSVYHMIILTARFSNLDLVFRHEVERDYWKEKNKYYAEASMDVDVELPKARQYSTDLHFLAGI